MELRESSPDVVIVGGGFAGVTAARELTSAGGAPCWSKRAIGWAVGPHTLDHDGHVMELGGTWVHPLQPHVWAKISRYGVAGDIDDYLEVSATRLDPPPISCHRLAIDPRHLPWLSP